MSSPAPSSLALLFQSHSWCPVRAPAALCLEASGQPLLPGFKHWARYEEQCGRSWESLVMDQKLPIWNSGCGVLSAFAKLRVIKLQVKAATPTKRLQLPVTRSASLGPGRFELLE